MIEKKVPFTISDARHDGDTVYIDLWYPRSEDNPKYIELDLMDVRAASGIRISYDFERDGWVIEREAEGYFDHDLPWEQRKNLWKEVAFVETWLPEND